jgi:hypothetical protein
MANRPNPSWPSKTGKPSGGGRGNNPILKLFGICLGIKDFIQARQQGQVDNELKGKSFNKEQKEIKAENYEQKNQYNNNVKFTALKKLERPKIPMPKRIIAKPAEHEENNKPKK